MFVRAESVERRSQRIVPLWQMKKKKSILKILQREAILMLRHVGRV